MARTYYAGHSYMGINFTFDSPCWQVFGFDSIKAREKYLDAHEYKDGNMVACAITRKDAIKILGARMDRTYEIGKGMYVMTSH